MGVDSLSHIFTSNILTVQFPDSAIVSLRHTQNTPEHMTVKVLTPGGKVSYIVPVLKVKRYTIHELFEKKLFFLIPFHIFVYEKDFKELEENKKKLKQLEEEYAAIRERLEIACQKKQLRSWHGRRISQNADTQIFLLQSKKFQYTFTKINVYWFCAAEEFPTSLWYDTNHGQPPFTSLVRGGKVGKCGTSQTTGL